MTDQTLAFLCYGQGTHVDETEFAVLSAWRAGLGRTGMLLYTDEPGRFAHLPVTVRRVDAEELHDWRGPYGYHHRIKAEVVADALRTLAHPVALVDSDTWFRRPVPRLFERVRPGTAVLHLSEGPLRSSNDLAKHTFADRVAGATVGTPSGALQVAVDADMWNSGVIGIHPADAAVVTDAMHLMDELWPGNESVLFLEQFALSQIAAARTRVRAADDVIYHYWPAELREPWRPRLGRLLAETAGQPIDERADRLHRARPRPQGRQVWRYRAKVAYRAAGFATPGVRSSAT